MLAAVGDLALYDDTGEEVVADQQRVATSAFSIAIMAALSLLGGGITLVAKAIGRRIGAIWATKPAPWPPPGVTPRAGPRQAPPPQGGELIQLPPARSGAPSGPRAQAGEPQPIVGPDGSVRLAPPEPAPIAEPLPTPAAQPQVPKAAKPRTPKTVGAGATPTASGNATPGASPNPSPEGPSGNPGGRSSGGAPLRWVAGIQGQRAAATGGVSPGALTSTGARTPRPGEPSTNTPSPSWDAPTRPRPAWSSGLARTPPVAEVLERRTSPTTHDRSQSPAPVGPPSRPLAYLQARGWSVTGHATNPLNVQLDADLRANPLMRGQFLVDLISFYMLVTRSRIPSCQPTRIFLGCGTLPPSLGRPCHPPRQPPEQEPLGKASHLPASARWPTHQCHIRSSVGYGALATRRASHRPRQRLRLSVVGDRAAQELRQALRNIHEHLAWREIRRVQWEPSDYTSAAFVVLAGVGLDHTPAGPFVENERSAFTPPVACSVCGDRSALSMRQAEPLRVQVSHLDGVGGTAKGDQPAPPGGWDLVNLVHRGLVVSHRVVEALSHFGGTGWQARPVIDVATGEPSSRAMQLLAERSLLAPCVEHTSFRGNTSCSGCGIVLGELDGPLTFRQSDVGTDLVFSMGPQRHAFLAIAQPVATLFREGKLNGGLEIQPVAVCGD